MYTFFVRRPYKIRTPEIPEFFAKTSGKILRGISEGTSTQICR